MSLIPRILTSQALHLAASPSISPSDRHVLDLFNHTAYEEKMHIESIPEGALVIWEPSGKGKPKTLGHTPLVVNESTLTGYNKTSGGSGEILVVFETKSLLQQLTEIPVLRPTVAEFRRNAEAKRESFAKDASAATFFWERYFYIPGNSTSLVATNGQLFGFGQIFELRGRWPWNRFVAAALPRGESLAALLPFMSHAKTWVAPKQLTDVPPRLRYEASQCISRCGYYEWHNDETHTWETMTAGVMKSGLQMYETYSYSNH